MHVFVCDDQAVYKKMNTPPAVAAVAAAGIVQQKEETRNEALSNEKDMALLTQALGEGGGKEEGRVSPLASTDAPSLPDSISGRVGGSGGGTKEIAESADNHDRDSDEKDKEEKQ
jgi:hypothetical protein